MLSQGPFRSYAFYGTKSQGFNTRPNRDSLSLSFCFQHLSQEGSGGLGFHWIQDLGLFFQTDLKKKKKEVKKGRKKKSSQLFQLAWTRLDLDFGRAAAVVFSTRSISGLELSCVCLQFHCCHKILTNSERIDGAYFKILVD